MQNKLEWIDTGRTLVTGTKVSQQHPIQIYVFIYTQFVHQVNQNGINNL